VRAEDLNPERLNVSEADVVVDTEGNIGASKLRAEGPGPRRIGSGGI